MTDDGRAAEYQRYCDAVRREIGGDWYAAQALIRKHRAVSTSEAVGKEAAARINAARARAWAAAAD